MTCPECELRLAEREFGAAVQDHLLKCAECRALADELRENDIALAAMREEELPLAVRPLKGGHRVKGRHRAPVWIAAGAAALVLFALGLPRHRERTVAPPFVAPVAASSPAPTLVAAAPVAAPAARKPRRRPVKPKLEQPEEAFMLKMLTPDPDVVIYWIVEPKERAE